MSDASARTVAVRVLRDIEQRRGFSNKILASTLAAESLDPRDRALVTTLVYGVLRHRARLDHHVDAVAHHPAKLRGETREIVRVGAYELLELGRPVAIAADEAARAARRLDPSGRLAGLTTALLGAIARGGPARDRALEDGPELELLARRWSIPPWLAARWAATLGRDVALARARALADAPSVDLRVDASRVARDEAAAQLAEWAPAARIECPAADPQCIRLHGAAQVWKHPLHRAGSIAVQGLGSQQPALLLAPRPGERVLDACAGMGGKTIQLAELMERRGELWAVDIDPRKLAELTAQRPRCDLDRPELKLEVRPGDLGDPDLEAGRFDAILLDAPCTGLGNLARHPELRWTIAETDVGECAATQRRLLAASLPRLAPGGRLVYAVCSLEPEEGPAVVGAVASEAGFVVAAERVSTPEADRTEGFYAALLRRA